MSAFDGSAPPQTRAEALAEALEEAGQSVAPKDDGGYMAQCPGHEDGKPSLSIDSGEDERALLYCFAGCATEEVLTPIGWRISDLFAGKTKHAAGKGKRVRSPVKPPEPLGKGAEAEVDLCHAALFELTEDVKRSPLAQLQRKRGISRDVAKSARLGWDAQRRAFTIPHYNRDGQLVAVERYKLPSDRRDGEHGLRAEKGATRWLYQPEPERRDEMTIVCEGSMDALAVLSATGRRVAATPSAGVWRDEWSRELHEGGARRSAVVFDADDAGRKGAEIAERSPRAAGIAAWRIDLAPERDDGYDATDYVLEHGGEALQARLFERVGARVRFVSAAELHDLVPDEPEWVWQGYLARGTVTAITSQPKVGKSTTLCALFEAIVGGDSEFLGHTIASDPIVYVSEEGGNTLKPKLPANPKLRVLTRELAWPRPPWAELISEAVTEAACVGAGLLVIDSLSFWVGFSEGQENDAAVVAQTMAALVEAANMGLAVLIVHHPPKTGGGLRGAGTLFSIVDALIEVDRLSKGEPANRRRLTYLGRFDTPPVLVFERDPARVGFGTQAGAYRVVAIGEEDAEQADSEGDDVSREAVIGALPEGEPGMSYAEIAKALGVPARKVSGPVGELVAWGLVRQSGRGVKGNPYRFVREQNSSPHSLPYVVGGIGQEETNESNPGRNRAGNSDLAPALCGNPLHRASDWAPSGATRWICGSCHPPSEATASSNGHNALPGAFA